MIFDRLTRWKSITFPHLLTIISYNILIISPPWQYRIPFHLYTARISAKREWIDSNPEENHIKNLQYEWFNKKPRRCNNCRPNETCASGLTVRRAYRRAICPFKGRLSGWIRPVTCKRWYVAGVLNAKLPSLSLSFYYSLPSPPSPWWNLITTICRRGSAATVRKANRISTGSSDQRVDGKSITGGGLFPLATCKRRDSLPPQSFLLLYTGEYTLGYEPWFCASVHSRRDRRRSSPPRPIYDSARSCESLGAAFPFDQRSRSIDIALVLLFYERICKNTFPSFFFCSLN